MGGSLPQQGSADAAAEALLKTAEDCGQITVLAMGPLTNIAPWFSYFATSYLVHFSVLALHEVLNSVPYLLFFSSMVLWGRQSCCEDMKTRSLCPWHILSGVILHGRS